MNVDTGRLTSLKSDSWSGKSVLIVKIEAAAVFAVVGPLVGGDCGSFPSVRVFGDTAT
jgi:hypothetical protein|tara:strand:+ start:4955 stop:5128 length:174 start_codon:yes stop_codon:yes gene_type:complete